MVCCSFVTSWHFLCLFWDFSFAHLEANALHATVFSSNVWFTGAIASEICLFSVFPKGNRPSFPAAPAWGRCRCSVSWLCVSLVPLIYSCCALTFAGLSGLACRVTRVLCASLSSGPRLFSSAFSFRVKASAAAMAESGKFSCFNLRMSSVSPHLESLFQ